MELKNRIEKTVTQSCLTLCDPIDYSPPGSSVRGILQARMLEQVFPSPQYLTNLGIEPSPLSLQEDSLPSEPPRKPKEYIHIYLNTHIFSRATLVAQWYGSTYKGNVGSIPGSGRYAEEETGNPFQHSFLGNPMDRGVCWATVHGVTEESDTT